MARNSLIKVETLIKERGGHWKGRVGSAWKVVGLGWQRGSSSKRCCRPFILSDWERGCLGISQEKNSCSTEGFHPGESMPTAIEGKVQGAYLRGLLLSSSTWAVVHSYRVCCHFQRCRNWENSSHSSPAVPRLLTGKEVQVQPTVAKFDILEAHMISTTTGGGEKHMLLSTFKVLFMHLTWGTWNQLMVSEEVQFPGFLLLSRQGKYGRGGESSNGY